MKRNPIIHTYWAWALLPAAMLVTPQARADCYSNGPTNQCAFVNSTPCMLQVVCNGQTNDVAAVATANAYTCKATNAPPNEAGKTSTRAARCHFPAVGVDCNNRMVTGVCWKDAPYAETDPGSEDCTGTGG